jgi:hypothetical protein
MMAMDGAVIDLAQQLWNYLCLDLPVEKADCIVGLGSYDLRVADRCAELYTSGWAPLIFSPATLAIGPSGCGTEIWPDMKVFFTSPRINFADQLQHGIQEGVSFMKWSGISKESRHTRCSAFRYLRIFRLAFGMHMKDWYPWALTNT